MSKFKRIMTRLQSITTMQHFSHLLASEKRLVLIDFHATWCGPCRAIAPFVEQLAASSLAEHVAFYKVNVDEAAEVAEYCNISAMPTFILYQGSQKVGEVKGANKSSLTNLLANATGYEILVAP